MSEAKSVSFGLPFRLCSVDLALNCAHTRRNYTFLRGVYYCYTHIYTDYFAVFGDDYDFGLLLLLRLCLYFMSIRSMSLALQESK